MAFDYVFAGSARSSDALSGLGRITINYYYQLSKPIIPTYGANPGAMLVLLALSVVLVAASFWLFARRDVSDVVSLWPRASQPRRNGSGASAATVVARAERDLSLRGVWVRALAANKMTLIWWMVGVGIYAVYGVFIAKSAIQALAGALKQSPLIAALFSGDNLTTNNGFVSAIIFTFVPFVSVLAAVFFALNWASDLDNGRMETTLSAAPLPRWRVLLERFITVIVGVVGVGLATALAAELGAALTGLTLDFGGLLSAGLGMIPLMLLASALVYALAGKLSSGTILGLVGGLASLSFVLELLRSVLNLPEWVMNLSIFHVYGQPMTSSVNGTGMIVMLVLAAALLALGTWLFTRADLRQ
jgi:ABC-2 type transport system permease protein